MSLSGANTKVITLPEVPMRNEKIVWVTPDVIVHLLAGLGGGWESLKIPQLGLPEDATVRAVYYSNERRAFAFFVAHPSFAEVRMGELAPTLEPKWREIELVTKHAHHH
jgi:hypothetical protein